MSLPGEKLCFARDIICFQSFRNTTGCPYATFLGMFDQLDDVMKSYLGLNWWFCLKIKCLLNLSCVVEYVKETLVNSFLALFPCA